MSLLNYIKQIWDTTSYVNPTRMNHIEEGIYAVSNKVDNLSADDIPYDNNNSVKDMIPKTKKLSFNNKSNSDTSTYYIVLTNDLIGDLNDNATEILSITLAGWSSVQNIVAIGFENNILYLLYPKGHTFSNASVSVQVAYR